MRKWKVAFMSSLGYATMAPEKVVRSLASCGYEAVEWTLSHFNPREHTPAQNRRLVEITHDAGMDVSEVVVQVDVVSLNEAERRDRIDLCLECIAAAVACGVSTLNFFTGPAPWVPTAPVVNRDISLGAAWDMIYDAYDQFVAAAEESGVYLALEGVWGHVCHDFYSSSRLIEHYNSAYLGVNLDPSHDILVGNRDSGYIARQWGVDRIRHVHLKDAVDVTQPGWFPMLGEGLVPWTDFFKALDEMEYPRYCSVEFEAFDYHDRVLRGNTEEAARVSRMQIRELLRPVYEGMGL
jgi:sugar phosphate isomerase/epimerase